MGVNYIAITEQNLTNAVKRCKQVKPRVTWLKDQGERVFSVTSSDGSKAYRVEFRFAGKQKLAGCECYANQAHSTCYHIAAAAAVNIAIQTDRRRIAKS